jgi:hypothetical protein
MLLLQADLGKILLTQALLMQMVSLMSTNILFNTRDLKTSLLSEMPLEEIPQEPTLLLWLKTQLSKIIFWNSLLEENLMESMMDLPISLSIWVTPMLLDSLIPGIINQHQTTMLSHNMASSQKVISIINWNLNSELELNTLHSRRIMDHHTVISLKHSTHWNTTKSSKPETSMLKHWELFTERRALKKLPLTIESILNEEKENLFKQK